MRTVVVGLGLLAASALAVGAKPALAQGTTVTPPPAVTAPEAAPADPPLPNATPLPEAEEDVDLFGKKRKKQCPGKEKPTV